MDDLVAFTNRDGLSAMVSAAIAHAQFESIHRSPMARGVGGMPDELDDLSVRIGAAARAKT